MLFIMNFANKDEKKIIFFPFRNLARIIKNENTPTEFDDPSEPIYTDPSMFERSR